MIEFEEVTPYTEGGGARSFQPGLFVARRSPLLVARRSSLAARGLLS
ncbi:MAG TPA: hypothetical protein VMO47_11160 [Rhodothermales bacterium]|nr:hypothetical protein [Rhodothermales bacterium]